MRGETLQKACEKLKQEDYGGQLVAERESEAKSGVVVEQIPEAGFRGGRGQGVDLIISEPFVEGSVRFDDTCMDARLR